MESGSALGDSSRPIRLPLLAGIVFLLFNHIGVMPSYAAGTPVIGAGGIVNAATFRSAVLPGGDIAQGSIFSIFGVDIGPAVGVGVLAFPSRTIWRGSRSR